MDWVWLLFSFEGRINRAKFYLAGLVLLCWMIFLLFLFVVLSAAYGDFRSFGLDMGLASFHATLDGPKSFHLGVNDIFALVDPATYRALPRTDIAAAPCAGAEEPRGVGWAECRAQPGVLVTPGAPTRSRHAHVRRRTDRSKRRAQPVRKDEGDGP